MENNSQFTHWQVAVLWSLLALFTFALVHYYANKKTPFYVYAAVFVGWLFPFSMVLLLPLDLTYNLYQECLKEDGHDCTPPLLYVSDGFLWYSWKIIYWTMFTLTFLIIPFIISYCDSGYFTFVERAKKSLRANFIFYGILLALGVVAVFWIIITNRFSQRDAILQFAMSAANIYGLAFLVVFLAYGLTEIPRSFWHYSNRKRSLRYLEYKAPQVKDALHDSEADYDTYSKDVQAISNSISMDDPLRPFVEVVVSSCSYGYNAGPVGDIPPQYQPLDLKKLAKLHKEVKRAVRDRERWEWEWSHLCQSAYHLQDIISQSNDTSMKFYSSYQSPHEGPISKFIPTIEWLWYVKLEPALFKILAILFGVSSIIIIWSEATYLIPHPLISIVGNIFNAPNISYVAVQFLSVLIMLYMCLCAIHSLFRVKIFNIFSIHPNHQTDEVSLCWFTNQMCRLTFPLGYNFMYMAGRKNTVLFSVMGEMVGASLQTFVPVMVTVIVLMNMFDVIDRILACLGFSDNLMNDEADKDGGWGDVEEGKLLISEARGSIGRGYSPDIRRDASAGLLAIQRPLRDHSEERSTTPNSRNKRERRDLSQTTSKYLLNNPLYEKYQQQQKKKQEES